MKNPIALVTLAAMLTAAACGGTDPSAQEAELTKRPTSSSSGGASTSSGGAESELDAGGSPEPSGEDASADAQRDAGPKNWELKFAELFVKDNGGNGSSTVRVHYYKPQVLRDARSPAGAWVDNQSTEAFSAGDNATHPLTTNIALATPLAKGNVLALRWRIEGTGEECFAESRHEYSVGVNGETFTNTTYSMPVWTGGAGCSAKSGQALGNRLEATLSYQLIGK